MDLLEILKSERAAIVERWTELTLQVYPEDAVRFMRREKDRFRNPVGHMVVDSLAQLFDGLVEEAPAQQRHEAIDGVIRLRAVQDLAPARSLSFVFLLKQAIGEVLGESRLDEIGRADLSRLHTRIDNLALEAFERFVLCREQIHESRNKEMRRNTASLLRRLERIDGTAEPDAPPADGTDRVNT